LLASGKFLHIGGDDAFVGKDHAVEHGFVRVDDVFAVEQR